VMLPWFVLALILRFTRWSAQRIIAAFLVLYTLQWFCYGCYLLAAGTLHGKLIIAERRGRLLAFSFVFGCGFAIVTAYFVMSAWLTSGNARYDSIFTAAGVFAGAAISVVFFLKEPPSPPLKDQLPFSKFIGDGLLLLLTDRNFRRLAGVMVLASTLWILFPHYTVFGKQRLGLDSPNFIALIIAQNAGHGTGALVMGPIADRYGNRIVLRMLIGVAGAVPLLAIAFSRLAFGAEIYWLMYAFLGFTFVLVRIFINYTLEIAPLEKHPQYLGVLSLFQSVPLFVSPLLGMLIDQFSFEPIFIGVSALTFGGAVLTFGLDEPRG
jgi:MFS family permease